VDSNSVGVCALTTGSRSNELGSNARMTIPDPSSIPLAPDPLDSELDRSESELMAGEHASPQKTTTDREGHGKGSPGEPRAAGEWDRQKSGTH
jgi:hypothetical protein